ncbi:MAG: polymorphic toxin type 35 domain-containing protein [Clostridium sp.]
MKGKLKYIIFTMLISIIGNIVNPFITSVLAITEPIIQPNEITQPNTESASIKWDYRCDINYDLVIDVQDLAEVASKYNLTSNLPGWNPKCDINKDSIVDIYDLVLVSNADGSSVDPLAFVSAKDVESRIDNKVKTEFLNVINSDKELLAYYNSSESQQKTQMREDISKLTSIQINEANSIVMNRGILSTLGNLNSQLIVIGMPVALRYSFVSFGAGIMAAIVDGPIPVGDIIAIIISVGAGAVIWYYWDYIQENSEKIIGVLKNVFYEVAGYIEGYYYNVVDRLDVYLSGALNSNLSKEEESVDRAGKDSNKIRHIMEPKHDWNKFFRDPKWQDVSPILLEVLRNGKEEPYKDTFMKSLVYLGEKVVVTYKYVIIAGQEFIRIGTAYIEK